MSKTKIESSLKGTFACLPKTTRGRPIVINGDPKGKNFLYTNGCHVIIRDIENPAICDVYSEHSKEAKIAKYAPSGFYIASGDISGKVRIWDTTQKEHMLKYEYEMLGGAIKDLVWSPDSKRIAICGEGRSDFSKVFMWDTGTSVGNLTNHHKSVNSIDFKQTRPFRIATGSEDFTVGYFEGPPFKAKNNMKGHTNFVQTVRFSPDGEILATGGSDGVVLLFNGSTSEPVGSLGEKAHKGGVYGISYSPDGRQILTVSGDKTAKIWDLESRSVVNEFVMGDQIDDMQVGCLWQNNHILTVSLSGYINYLDVNNPNKPLRIIKGHSKSIMALAASSDKSTIFTGSFDGHINYMDAESFVDDEMQGKGHSNQVSDMKIVDDTLVTIGMDDTIRFSSASEKKYGSAVTKLDSQPKSVDSCGSISIVASISHITVFDGEKKVSSTKINYEALSVAIHPKLTEVAVGGLSDHKLHIYDLSNGSLNERIKLEVQGGITDMKYSPDGEMLLCAMDDKCVKLFQLPNYPIMIDSTGHTSRVTSVAWPPNSQYFATASIDSHIFIWKAEATFPVKNTSFRAHPNSQINRVEWLDDHTLLSVAQDALIKKWNITY
ncbi:hypothetical protein LOTGIDRAFT_191449 [Lottia gigantea]|uniref:Actin-interacting protein 1 n=1 Tax=Lottia gigantea TaxID=225164 RepID=V4BQ33_LOTGI|nr:hypothetical protein LOTGIDRAFT_191449 [Lottia gigantea]ESO90974.1 hypothetical protein LOTGIDRAFT_191449 [Lottia gigantea]